MKFLSVCPSRWFNHQTHRFDIVRDCVHALSLGHANYRDEERNVDGSSEGLVQGKLDQGVLDAEDLLPL